MGLPMDEARPSLSPPDEPPALHTALAAHIQALASRPLTARSLVELQKSCVCVRTLIAIGQDPGAVKAPNVQFPNAMNFMSSVSPYEESPSDYGYAMPAMSTAQETFGAQAIRQLLEIVPALLPKPAETVFPFKEISEAILLAKVNGDESLEADLRAVLRQRVLAAPDPEVPALSGPSLAITLSEAAE